MISKRTRWSRKYKLCSFDSASDVLRVDACRCFDALATVCVFLFGSLQVQVHQEGTQDQIQGCSEAGDQAQTPLLPREDDFVSDTSVHRFFLLPVLSFLRIKTSERRGRAHFEQLKGGAEQTEQLVL